MGNIDESGLNGDESRLLGDGKIDRRHLLAWAAAAGVSATMFPKSAAAMRAARASIGGRSAANPSTFVFAMSAPVVNLDREAGGAASLANALVIYACYDNLLDYALPTNPVALKTVLANGPKPTPKLVQSWELRGTTYRFHLRKGVKSNFGNLFTADDVLWAIARNLYNNRAGAFFLSLNGITDLSQVKAIDQYTVDFMLPQPSSVSTPFLLTFGIGANTIYDSTEAKKHATSSEPYAKTWLASNIAGFGPYQIAQYSTGGAQVTLQARGDYWGQKPALKTIVINAVTESSLRLQLLLSNNAHYASELAPLEIEQVLKSNTAKVTHVNDTSAAYLALTQTFPWNARKVRQAIAHALPYNDILRTVFQGQAKPYKSVLAPIVPGYTPDFGYKTDLVAARKVLSTIQQPLTLSYADGLPVDEQIAVLSQGALRAAGLNVTLDKEPRSIFDGKKFARKGALQLFPDRPDTPAFESPDYYFVWQSTETSPLNFFHWKSARLDQLRTIMQTGNKRARAAAIREGQQIMMADLPIFPLAWTGTNHALAKSLNLPKAHAGNGIPHFQDFTLNK